MQPTQYPPQQSAVQDPLRIPRRQVDPEDILDIVRRNKSWIAGPALAGLVIAVVTAFLWPDTYVSTAVIRVQPPQVPASFVPTNVTTQMSQRINLMAQTILSRGTLTSIIETYGLYTSERQALPLEDVIEQMRDDISIGSVRNIQATRGNTMTAFRISFAYENRYLAQKVTAHLVSRFINENTRERANQSAMTTQFLRDQWQSAKNDLDEIEQRLTEFRIRNQGQLPDQWNANMQQLAAMETRMAAQNGQLGRLSQEKLVLESEIRVLQEQIKAVASARPAESGSPQMYADPVLARLDLQIQNSERSLAELLDNYTPNHPDVKRYESQIELLRKERKQHLAEIAGEKGQDTASPRGPVLTPEQASKIRDLNTQVENKQIQVRSKVLEIANARKAMAAMNKRTVALQARLERAPVGEQEYAALMRDYDLRKRRYDDLNMKMSQSEIASDLENRKQGETLELLDPASLPQRPTEPMRPVIILLGLALGAGMGGVLVFLREVKDNSLKTLKDVRAYTQLAILGSIPLLENDLVVMRRRRMAWLGWTTASVLAVAAMAGAVYYYYATKV